MPTATTPRAIDRKEDLATLKSLWKEMRDALTRTKKRIDGEIRSYPTPIPLCDAQFSYLYEQQARLARELDRTVSGKRLEREDRLELIERFAASAPYTDEPAERDIRLRMRAALAAVRKPGRTET